MVDQDFTKSSKSLEQLDTIFQSVKQQINQWGENAKWKIDLVLLDNPNQHASSTLSNQQQIHPLLSPQQLHPNAITAPSSAQRTSFSLPITSTTQYPWDYVAPKSSEFIQPSDEASRKLHESLERQKYLESVIWAQADQIKQASLSNSDDSAINTMKSVFLLSQNEQKLQYLVETERLQKDIDALSNKLKKMASTLENIEQLSLTEEEKSMDKNALLEDRKTLLRKLHLADLRLSARDAEIDYLQEVLYALKTQSQESSNHTNSNHVFSKKLRRGPPYLFQQQFSPRSDVRSSEQQTHLSALDSLGIVADQMLSDPEFDTNHHDDDRLRPPEKRFRSRLGDRRSQRSIDSAATLLAMPQLMVPQRIIEEEQPPKQSPTSSPEQTKATYDHIPKKPRSTYTRWTEAEDKLLRAAVKKYGHSNWEACSKEIQGRSNIQCRNRWIRHLEHKPVPVEEQKSAIPSLNANKKDTNARHSPSIAALLNSNGTTSEEKSYHLPHFSPRATPKQTSSEQSNTSSGYLQPTTYRPPSPIATPKNGKRKAPETLPALN